MYRMRLFLLSLIVISSMSASACLSAHQNRIFPVGISTKGLLVLEVHLNRGDNAESEDGTDELGEPIWYGKVYCNLYKEYQLQQSDTLGILKDFKEHELPEKLKPYFHLCHNKIKDLPAFKAAERTSIMFCGYSEGCNAARIVADTINQTASVYVKNNEGIGLPVFSDKFPLYEDYQAYFGEVEDTVAYIASLQTGLLIGSVRRYKCDKKELVIIHLESGQPYPDPEEDAKVHAAESKRFIETGFFTEPVMHHGHGFDFYILE